MRLRSLLLAGLALTVLNGCVSTIIGATTDAAIAVVKIPFKVGRAAIDIARGEDEDDDTAAVDRRDHEKADAQDNTEQAPQEKPTKPAPQSNET